jgi:hypothetical protein
MTVRFNAACFSHVQWSDRSFAECFGKSAASLITAFGQTYDALTLEHLSGSSSAICVADGETLHSQTWRLRRTTDRAPRQRMEYKRVVDFAYAQRYRRNKFDRVRRSCSERGYMHVSVIAVRSRLERRD